jgi:hypothetical protein
MFHHSTNTALFLSILMSALIFSLSMAEVAAALEGNTDSGGALFGTTPPASTTPPSVSRRSVVTPRASIGV